MDHARRILIVDDEPALLRMMSLYLGRLGYSVAVSNSTEEAWSEVQKAPLEFTAAVLDATMPGLSMMELALNMLAANPAMCVVAASGYPVDMSDMEAVAPGRVVFLQKPFTGDMLAQALRTVLGA